MSRSKLTEVRLMSLYTGKNEYEVIIDFNNRRHEVLQLKTNDTAQTVLDKVESFASLLREEIKTGNL